MSLDNTFDNACKVIAATRKVADSYNEVHFWQRPDENTFNYKLCQELGLPPDSKSMKLILKIVEDWTIHKDLKAMYNGNVTNIFPTRKC